MIKLSPIGLKKVFGKGYLNNYQVKDLKKGLKLTLSTANKALIIRKPIK